MAYAWVPAREVRGKGRASGSSDGGDLLPTGIPDGPVVLRGFLLEFSGTDRPLNRIGVLAPNGELAGAVSFADKNGDDDFEWQIDWGLLGGVQSSPDPIFRPVRE